MTTLLLSLLLFLSAHAAHRPRAVRELAHVERTPDSGQYIQTLIHADDDRNPIMLFVMGGLGTPAVLMESKLRGFARDHVVITFTSRGVLGINDTAVPNGTLSHLHDAIFVAEHMLRRFGQSRLFLTGLSFGSDMALQIAQRRPDLVHGVVAMSAFVDMQLHTPYYLDEMHRRMPLVFRKLLWLIGTNHFTGFILQVYISAMYGFVSYKCKDAQYLCYPSDIQMPWEVYLNPAVYGVGHFLGLIGEISRTIASNHDMVDVLRPPYRLRVPVVFFSGRHDLWMHTPLVHRLIDEVDAPYKRHVVFNYSAHFILQGETELATRLTLQAIRDMASYRASHDASDPPDECSEGA